MPRSKRESPGRAGATILTWSPGSSGAGYSTAPLPGSIASPAQPVPDAAMALPAAATAPRSSSRRDRAVSVSLFAPRCFAPLFSRSNAMAADSKHSRLDRLPVREDSTAASRGRWTVPDSGGRRLLSRPWERARVGPERALQQGKGGIDVVLVGCPVDLRRVRAGGPARRQSAPTRGSQLAKPARLRGVVSRRFLPRRRLPPVESERAGCAPRCRSASGTHSPMPRAGR